MNYGKLQWKLCLFPFNFSIFQSPKTFMTYKYAHKHILYTLCIHIVVYAEYGIPIQPTYIEASNSAEKNISVLWCTFLLNTFSWKHKHQPSPLATQNFPSFDSNTSRRSEDFGSLYCWSSYLRHKNDDESWLCTQWFKVKVISGYL